MHFYTHVTGNLPESTPDIPSCRLPVVHLSFDAFNAYAKTGHDTLQRFTQSHSPADKQALFKTLGFVTRTVNQNPERLARIAANKKSGYNKVSLNHAFQNGSLKLFVLHLHDATGSLYSILDYTQRLTHHRDGRHGAAVAGLSR